MSKRANGRYYTKGNPFSLKVFKDWIQKADLKKNTVLEPFAGKNSLIDLLKLEGYVFNYKSYDIKPAEKDVSKRDTLKNFPKGFNVCITNPPWLAKNSACRRKLPYPNTKYDDLYKYALSLCLNHCGYVAAIIPESFITSGLFLERLTTVVSLPEIFFDDTEHPVCIALFEPGFLNSNSNSKIKIYKNSSYIGSLENLKKYLPVNTVSQATIKFNAPDGNVGFIAVDNTTSASIRFCPVEELKDYEVKVSSRSITKIKINADFSIEDLNKRIKIFREKTGDVFLTAFKGLRKDTAYRRRMDYKIVRGIISESLNKNNRCWR